MILSSKMAGYSYFGRSPPPILPPQRGYSKKNLSRNLDLDLFAEYGENGGSGIRKCLKPIWFIRLNSSIALDRAIKYVQALR